MKEYINKVIEGKNLTTEEAAAAMDIIMSGEATPAQIGSYLTALRMKGETIEEITGCAKGMREKYEYIHEQLIEKQIEARQFLDMFDNAM